MLAILHRHHGSLAQLDRLAVLIVSTMQGDALNDLTSAGSTVRMLRRADVYELKNLQGGLS